MSRRKGKRFAFLVLFIFVFLKFGTLLFWPGWEKPEMSSTPGTLYAEKSIKKRVIMRPFQILK